MFPPGGREQIKELGFKFTARFLRELGGFKLCQLVFQGLVFLGVPARGAGTDKKIGVRIYCPLFAGTLGL